MKRLWKPAGRYGGDKLGVALLLLTLAFMLTSRFSGIGWLGLLGYIPLIYFVFRFLSRNFSRRYMELNGFMKIYGPVERFVLHIPQWFRDEPARREEKRRNSHFKCPSCRQKLRVPKGRGKIEITCPACKTVFFKTT
ncbi:MAG: hypothetical protein Q4G07_04530 [Oscillospiraceae bacterium]|nr:hypothetical protein [Oscillospiraceae bacterium]